MYIPPLTNTLENQKIGQIRLGLQGPGGEGKTTAALTFPNPIVYNVNRGLGAFGGRKDIIEIPAWDFEWQCKFYNKKFTKPSEVNRRDILNHWIEREGIKLEREQTFIIDALSDIESAHYEWEDANPTYSKQGKIDDFAEWKHKIAFFGELDGLLKSLKCHVVLCTHEQVDRNKDGELNGKIKVLLTGQSGDKIVSFFTDWFRQRAADKLAADKVTAEILDKFKMTKNEFIEWQNTFPRGTTYFWETESSSIFSGKCSSLINFPKYLPATFESFKKYMRSNGV